MPTIRDISLTLGRNSLSEDEVVLIRFNVDFSPEEQKLTEGFILHILLLDVNGGIDDFRVGPSGIYLRREKDEKDRIVGEIYRDIIHPNGPVLRVDRTKSWDFGEMGKGEEEFRAVIAVIPRNWEHSPAISISQPVRIDLG
jgi:hypothetical protein